MITLGQITDSEYNLLGAMDEEELLGALEAANQPERRRFLKRVQQQTKNVSTQAGHGSRREFEKRVHLLPRDIQAGLANQSLQAVDSAYYSIKAIDGSKVQKMFKDDDNKVVGMSNISSGKLEKGNFMLLWGIILLAGVKGLNQTYADVNFNVIPDYIRNGEFEFKANGTVMIPNTSCEVFNTEGKDTFKGLYILDNPKIIKDQHTIEFNLEWGSNAPTNIFLKAILRGTSVIKS